MITKKKTHKHNLYLALIIIAVVGVISFAFTLKTYYTYYYKRFLPNTFIANYNIGGKTENEAYAYLYDTISLPDALVLISSSETGQKFEIPLQEIGFSYNLEKSIDEAKVSALNKKPIDNIRLILNPKSKLLPLVYSFDQAKLNTFIDTILSEITQDPVYPSAKLLNSEVVIQKGSPGQSVDKNALVEQIKTTFAQNSLSPIYINLEEIDPTLNSAQVEQYKNAVTSIVDKKLTLQSQDYTHEITDTDIATFLQFDGSWNEELIAKKIQDITTAVNRESQNSVFVFEENKVKEFLPAKDGLAVKKEQLTSALLSKLNELASTEVKESTLAIPLEATPPKISNEDVNNLGIKELIGRGTSRFRGSIPSRVHNVALAASNINGALIKPGETFSFNQALGDVSKLTGYKEAYVIKDGKTVLGDGGGVCQVSTTFFRAALDAGLPVVERRGHSYRVGYYEQDAGPGLDATVYSPTTDLKVVNDTPGHILVQARTDTKNLTLVFELYGSSDGRVSTITKPVMSNVAPPPEDLYVDDPTLAAGQVKQIEHKAWGGKSTFKYEVKKGDEVVYQKTFVTNFRPWQAVYLRGTAPAQ